MKLPNALRPAAIGKFALTAAVVAAAVYAGWQLWVHYEVEPWTRDGRVKAYVVQVAPDVSGLVTAVPVHDNQDVKAGDVLFEIDRARFQLAYDQAQASVRSQQVAREQALRDAKRNRSLGQLVAAEALEQSQTKLQQTEAALAQADQTVDTLREGVEVTLKQLAAAFERNLLKEIAPVQGDKFDPHLHQAISSIPAEQPANTVVQLLQKGYVIADRTLRPALVVVSAGQG